MDDEASTTLIALSSTDYTAIISDLALSYDSGVEGAASQAWTYSIGGESATNSYSSLVKTNGGEITIGEIRYKVGLPESPTSGNLTVTNTIDEAGFQLTKIEQEQQSRRLSKRCEIQAVWLGEWF